MGRVLDHLLHQTAMTNPFVDTAGYPGKAGDSLRLAVSFFSSSLPFLDAGSRLMGNNLNRIVSSCLGLQLPRH
jgi:hypothetical protein